MMYYLSMLEQTALTDTDPNLLVNRCDRCGAQAYLFFVFRDESELAFCAHHGNKYYNAAAEVSKRIIDMRHMLEN
jgi:hypothetical protein